MSRLAASLALLAATPLIATAARAEGPRASGRIETEGARVEILNRPVRVGETIELPEGWIRVEEQGTEDEEIGSFSVVPAEAVTLAPSRAEPGPAAAPPEAEPAVLSSPAAARRAAETCRGERSAYLRELWKGSGIDVSDPEAVMAGLRTGASGLDVDGLWLALSTDAIRPLAWSSELRSRAEALARCVRAQ